MHLSSQSVRDTLPPDDVPAKHSNLNTLFSSPDTTCEHYSCANVSARSENLQPFCSGANRSVCVFNDGVNTMCCHHPETERKEEHKRAQFSLNNNLHHFSWIAAIICIYLKCFNLLKKKTFSKKEGKKIIQRSNSFNMTFSLFFHFVHVNDNALKMRLKSRKLFKKLNSTQ